MMTVAQGFLSGVLQTTAQIRAPDYATRANSCAVDITSGKNMKPNRHRTASKLPSAKGNAPASQDLGLDVLQTPSSSVLRGHLQHALGQISDGDATVRDRRRSGEPRLAGASGHVDNIESSRTGWTCRIIAAPKGASQSTTNSSHAFQPAENRSQVSRC